MEKSNEKSLSDLYQQYANILADENKTYMTDEEMIFMTMLTKVNPIENSNNNVNEVKNYLHKMCDNIIKNLKDVFDKMEVKELINDSSNLNTFTDQINTTKQEINKMSITGLTILGNVIFFLMRVCKRAIFKAKLYKLQGNPDKDVKNIKKNLDGLFMFASNVLKELKDIETKANDRVKSLIEKSSKYNAIMADPDEPKRRLNGVDRELFAFISLARNFIALFDKFKYYADQNKIINAKKKANHMVLDVHRLLQDTDALGLIGYRKPIYETQDEYETLKQFLVYVASLEGAEDKFKRQAKDINMSMTIFNTIKTYFSQSSNLYTKCLELFEFLSGSVRVIVKKLHYTQTDDSYPTYSLNLDKNYKVVSFQNISDLYDLYFKGTTLKDEAKRIFGPFYGVYESEMTPDEPKSDVSKSNKANEDAQKLTDQIVSESLNFERLATMLKKQSTKIVLYSYGYSGTGKTYTFFGRREKSDTWQHGVIWRLFQKLREQDENVQIKLVKRIKVYGYLQPNDTNVAFTDTVTTYIGENATNDDHKWVTTINEDLNDMEFIKRTSNNPDSSRGFYILKFEVAINGIKSYVGVVDMAGNEDPYDIASVMGPTLSDDSQMLLQFMSSTETPNYYDVVYYQIVEVLAALLHQFVAITILLIDIGYIDSVAREKIKNKKALFDIFSIYHLLDNSLEIKPGKASIKKTLRDGNELSFDTVTITKDKNKKLVLNCKITKTIFLNALKHQLTKLEEQTTKQNDEIKTYNTATILDASIKAKGKPDGSIERKQLLLAKLKYALIYVDQPGIQWKDIPINIAFKYESIMDTFQKIKNEKTIPAAYENALGSMYNQSNFRTIFDEIQKQLEKTFKDADYIIPLTDNKGQQYKYKYSTLAQIIKEGFYINKANAELIDFFKRRRNFEDPIESLQNKTNVNNPKKQSHVSPSIKFMGNFDFNSYDKFSVQFPKGNGVVTKYDTSLVKTITNEFPGDETKHIMFACVRDDKQLDKIIGAISTLYLIQDLKST